MFFPGATSLGRPVWVTLGWGFTVQLSEARIEYGVAL